MRMTSHRSIECITTCKVQQSECILVNRVVLQVDPVMHLFLKTAHSHVVHWLPSIVSLGSCQVISYKLPLLQFYGKTLEKVSLNASILACDQYIHVSTCRFASSKWAYCFDLVVRITAHNIEECLFYELKHLGYLLSRYSSLEILKVFKTNPLAFVQQLLVLLEVLYSFDTSVIEFLGCL